MNKAIVSRTAHIGIAGLIALVAYIAVVYFFTGQADNWNFFGNENCKNVVGGAFCLIAGFVRILFKVLTIGLPLALLFSGIYLKVVRFSWAALILIPLGANILGIIAIVLIGQYFSDIPLSLLAAIIPIAYLAVGIPAIRKNSTPLGRR